MLHQPKAYVFHTKVYVFKLIFTDHTVHTKAKAKAGGKKAEVVVADNLSEYIVDRKEAGIPGEGQGCDYLNSTIADADTRGCEHKSTAKRLTLCCPCGHSVV